MNERNDGISFEIKVERWLIRKGAIQTERRERVPGRIAKNGHECDVHAVFGGSPGPFIALLCVAFVVMLVGGLTQEVAVAAFGGISFIVMAVAAGATSLSRTHIWVEAKSGDAPVRRDVVWKLVEQLRDVREHGPAWYPAQAWLVVRSAFDVDAIRFAHEHGIRCFVEQAGDIREVL